MLAHFLGIVLLRARLRLLLGSADVLLLTRAHIARLANFVLTALGLEGTERWYLQAKDSGMASTTPAWNRASSSELDGVGSQSG